MDAAAKIGRNPVSKHQPIRFSPSVEDERAEAGRDDRTCLFFFLSLISLIADGPHHYHPACGHKGSSHLSPVHALRFFIAMQVQHSYNSSTNG